MKLLGLALLVMFLKAFHTAAHASDVWLVCLFSVASQYAEGKNIEFEKVFKLDIAAMKAYRYEKGVLVDMKLEKLTEKYATLSELKDKQNAEPISYTIDRRTLRAIQRPGPSQRDGECKIGSPLPIEPRKF